MKKPLILVGGGGHCKSVIDVAESAGYTILGILDKPEEIGKHVFGYEVIGTDDDMAKYADKAVFVVTVGQIKSPDYCHISTGATVNGAAKVGEQSFVGSQSVVNQCVAIGERVVIGAGSAVVSDLPDGSVAVGVPAKPINKTR